jgi:hypothetical protein
MKQIIKTLNIYVLIQIKSYMQKKCALCATIKKANQKWLVIVNIQINLIIQMECAKIATWLNTI